jgi:hypothetical protein
LEGECSFEKKGVEKMKKANKKTVNRCFGKDSQDPSSERNREKIKEVLSDAAQRKRANRELNNVLQQFKGKNILDLLPAIARRCSKAALRVAIERVERRQNDLNRDDFAFFEKFKQEQKLENGVS